MNSFPSLARRGSRLWILLFVSAVLSGSLLQAGTAHAQSTAATISGVVSDSTGAAIPNATVTIANPLSGFNRTVQTDPAGNFQFNNLPLARYHLSAVATGFAAAVQDAAVRSPGVTAVNFALAVSSNQTVTVEAEAEDMVSTEAVSSSSVDRVLMERLPTEGASAGLGSVVTQSTPGVVSDSNGLYHPMGEHADTTYSIDGQPVSDQQSRNFGNQLSTSAIQSVNVIDGIAPPEFGDKASLVVQATTRSGLGAKPNGSVSFNYGSFGSATANVSLALGGSKWGNFGTLDGLRSGRYLDSPELRPLHDRGNSESFFDRVDWKPNAADAFQFNVNLARSWFQQPNQYDQQAVGQDQRAQIRSLNLSPQYTHVWGTQGLLTVNPYYRRDQFQYFPSHNILADTPVSLGQNRYLQNTGVKLDYSLQKGVHTLKFGTNVYHTLLDEHFALAITDPNYAGPVQYNVALGGKPFTFNGHTDIKQEALYAQDTIAWRNWVFLLGGRADNYTGLSHRTLLQPRLGATYNVKASNTVLRVGFGKLMLTPYNENLLVSSSTGVGGLESGGAATPLKPASRTQYDAGFEQGITKHLIVNAEYFWKYTDRDFDFDTLLNSPLAFPIQWRKSKIDGFGIKVNVPEVHGVSAYAVLGHTRARFFRPEVGGILFNDPTLTTGTEPFRIDHDQAFEQTTHLQYQPLKHGPWYGVSWRYESGEVAGNAPFSTSTNPNDPIDLTYLTADQQQQAALVCGSQRATLSAPLSSCAGGQLHSPLLRFPVPGTENDDRNPPRVAPRSVFDMALGWDDVLHHFRPTERLKTNLSVTAVNVTNQYALYNFLSTFSGTHFLSPRTLTGQITFNF